MFVLSDRVKESSTSQGLLDHIVLNDTYGTFQSFASGVGDGNNTYYTIENNNNYEIGIGLYQESGNKLFRNTILDSSHEGGKITLLGVSTVFCTYPADRSVFLNENGFMSGQYPHYSGVAFSDGSIQTHAFDGRGSKDFVAFWTSPTALSGNRNLQFDIANNTLEISGVARFDSDVFISGNLDVFGTQTITNTQVQNSQFELTTLSDTTFRLDDTAGCFFHAYVDNSFDNTIALHSTNEANPTWKLGLKDYSPSFSTAPSRGYIFGDFDTIGGFATENHGFVVNATNGFWVKHLNSDIFNVQRSKGLTIYNDSSVVVPLNVRAAAGQSSNLQEWKDYSESVLASISSDGQISVPSIKFPDGTVQTSVGVGIVTSGIIGSGTTNFIPKFSDTDTITDSVISENGGRIGINTDNPVESFEVFDSGNAGAGSFYFAAGNHSDAVGTYVVNDNYASGDSFYALGLNDSASAVSWVMMNDAKGLGTDDTFVLMKGNISSNDVKFAVDANGNAMIGRTSNNNFVGYNTLSIDGVTGSFIDLYATSAAKLRIQGNSSDATIQTLESIPLRFKTNQLDRMRITEDGNVGINTTAPTNQLDVYVTGVHAGATIRGYNAPALKLWDMSYAGGGSKIAEQASSLHSGVLIIDADTNNVGHGSYMSLRVDGTERVQITEHGSVDIGTSSYPGTLTVTHLASGCGIDVLNPEGHGLQLGECAYGSYGSSYNGDLYTGVTHTKLDDPEEYMLLSKGDHTFVSAKEGYSSFIRSGKNGTTYQLMVTPSYLGVGLNNERMKINSQKVEFNLNNENYDFVVNGILDSLIHVDASTDRIGIGTSTPTAELDIEQPTSRLYQNATDTSHFASHYFYSSGVMLGGLLAYGSDYSAGSYMNLGSGTFHLFSNYEALAIQTGGVNKPIIFGTNTNSSGGERMRITGDGKVGIGTDNPSGKLHIQDGTLHILSDGSIPHFELVDTDTDNTLRLNATNSVFAFNLDPDENITGSELRFNVDNSDKFILKSSINELKQTTQIEANNNLVQFGNSITVINGNEENIDLQVKGDSDANLFYVDASTDRIGIGTATPAYKLDVQQGSVRFGSGIAVASNTILAKTNENIQLDGPNIYDGWLIAHVADCYGVGNNNNDGLLIEKRDGNGTYPDGGIIFANRGMNGNSIPSLSINGFGDVAIGKMVSPFNQGNKLSIDSGNFVFNGDNGNYDFKVHGDTDQNLLFCDASTDRVGIGTDSPTQRLDVNSSGIRIRHSQTPASGSAAGNQGDIVWDTNYVYICVETNTWKRSALSTF